MDRSRRLPLSNAPGLAFIRYPEVVGNVQFVMEPKLVVNAGRVHKKGGLLRFSIRNWALTLDRYIRRGAGVTRFSVTHQTGEIHRR